MTADRRAEDQRMDRLERMVERQGEQIAAVGRTVDIHVAVCTDAEKLRVSDRGEMKANLDTLVKAAAQREWTVKIARYLWGIIVAAAALVAWTWDHVGPWLAKLGHG